MGWAEGFSVGTNIGRSLVDTYNEAKRRQEIEDAAEAGKQTSQQQTNTESTYGKVDPESVYEGDGADGAMTNAEAASFGVNVPKQDKEAGTGITTKFGLGVNPASWQDKPFTPAEQRTTNLQAQSDFYTGKGNLDAAGKIQNQLRTEKLQGREDVRFDREERSAKRAEAYETGRQQVFNSSIFGQKNASFAKQFGDFTAAKGQYEQALAAGTPAEQLGAPPQPPSRPAYSIADSLADQGTLLAYDAQHNKVDAKTFGEFSERMRKVEDEGYLKALNLAQGGGSLEDVAKAFNASGTMQFDPKAVVFDTMVKGANGVPERVITIKDPNGSTHSINVMSELKSLGKAHEALTFFYKGKEDARADIHTDTELVKANNDMRRSQFDQKEVDKYYAPPKDITSYADPMDPTKQVPVPGLHEAYTSEYIRRVEGGVSPARASADTIVQINKLRDLAEKRVSDAKLADKKSTLTVGQAVNQINSEVRRAQAAAPQAQSATAVGSAAGAVRSPSYVPQIGDSTEDDRVQVARQELRDTRARIAAGSSDPVRDNADVQGILRELQRLGASEVPASAAPGPAQAAAAAAPVAPAVVGAPPQAPATQAATESPMDAPMQKLDAAALKSGWTRQKSNSPSRFGSYGLGKPIYIKRGESGAIEMRSPEEMASQLGLVW